uniref:Extradiol ring-cleavage dioxygenase class III enzyme subunit B domain-containing protein n=1 Tax=Aegilops tauschii subsp. strangulata TaxID=200361 RepID=A0A453G2T8_AEGTS
MGQTHSQAKPKPEDRHATPQPRADDHHQEHPEAATGRRPPAAPAMDTFFLSHGSPTLSIDEAIPARSFFQSWLPAAVAGSERPRAILIVSAHWETATPAVNVVRGANDTIHDFYGFPKSMYQVRSPACLFSLSRARFRRESPSRFWFD